VKVPADLDAVRERLRAAGAERLAAVEQVDTYYDAPHRDFAESDEALRVREERPREGADGTGADGDGCGHGNAAETRLTYKGPLVEAASKTREEFETAVGDGDAIRGVLDGVGFAPAATVRKDRECYDLDGYTVTLDRVADVGTYVEVEREATESEVKTVREGAVDVLRRLGLDPDDQVRTSYLGLLLDGA